MAFALVASHPAVLAVQPLAVDIVRPVVAVVNLVILLLALAIEAIAFVHCLMQRPDAFKAVGSLSKGIWLALTGGGVLVTLLLGPISILGLVGTVAAAVYLLDIRPAIKDVVDGSGPW